MKGNKWICKKPFRRITVGTIVYVLPIGVGYFANEYQITAIDSSTSVITNGRELLNHFNEYKEEK